MRCLETSRALKTTSPALACSDYYVHFRQIRRFAAFVAFPEIHERRQCFACCGGKKVTDAIVCTNTAVNMAAVRLPERSVFINEHIAEGQIDRPRNARVRYLHAPPCHRRLSVAPRQ